ncbi:hypothetical protein FRC17_011233 [Serendipita sp. 399]|nr:hypothetical protein FRC17_011233 [Serendipita sp. 399]
MSLKRPPSSAKQFQAEHTSKRQRTNLTEAPSSQSLSGKRLLPSDTPSDSIMIAAVAKLKKQVKKVLHLREHLPSDLFFVSFDTTLSCMVHEVANPVHFKFNQIAIGQQLKKLNDIISSWDEAAVDEQYILIGKMEIGVRELWGLYKSAHEVVLTKQAMPTPSAFGKRNVWPKAQEGPDAILCLRPPDKQGLPLILLHSAFLTFVNELDRPLSPADAPVLKISRELCKEMAKPYDEDTNSRTDAFNEAIRPVFPTYDWLFEFSLGSQPGSSGKLDGALSDFRILRVDKAELGSNTSDPYMQLARGFQAFIKWKQASGSNQGAPGTAKFLLIIVGPMLIVAGGFYDGVSIIVEPLIQPLLMLPDGNNGGRPMAIAKCMVALKKAVELLPVTPIPESLVPATPRIYSLVSGGEQSAAAHAISFERPLRHLGDFLFLGRIDDEDECLIKLVYGSYGTEVHCLLARQGLAPKLYGTEVREGAPTAIAMEHLEPYDPIRGGWMTLHELVGSSGIRVHTRELALGVKRIVDRLSESNFVHGDLRSNNLMVHVESDQTLLLHEEIVHVKAIDFDWSGESGKVFYPLERNAELYWPGEIGQEIVVGHDEAVVAEWWPKTFQGELFTNGTVPLPFLDIDELV